MGFEELIKLILGLSFALCVPTAGYVGYRYAMMWLRRYEREGELLAGAGDPEMAARLERLEAEVGELQERLEFAERLLARGAESTGLLAGDPD